MEDQTGATNNPADGSNPAAMDVPQHTFEVDNQTTNSNQ